MSTPQTQWIILSMVFLVLAAVFGTLWFITNQNYTTLLASYNTLKVQYDNLQTQCNTLQAELNNLQSQYSSCETQLNNLQAQNTQLKQELQSCGLITTLQVQAVGLTGVSSNSSATLTLLVSNPSSSGIGINGFTLGSLSCVLSTPIQIPAGTQGAMIQITLPVANGYFATSGVSVNGTGATCSGSQAAQVGIQYSGYITTVNGQTYPFTVTASS
jgi:FtsZ-binding cell division protein ZapB